MRPSSAGALVAVQAMERGVERGGRPQGEEGVRRRRRESNEPITRESKLRERGAEAEGIGITSGGSSSCDEI